MEKDNNNNNNNGFHNATLDELLNALKGEGLPEDFLKGVHGGYPGKSPEEFKKTFGDKHDVYTGENGSTENTGLDKGELTVDELEGVTATPLSRAALERDGLINSNETKALAETRTKGRLAEMGKRIKEFFRSLFKGKGKEEVKDNSNVER